LAVSGPCQWSAHHRSISAGISSVFWLFSAFQLRQIRYDKTSENIREAVAAEEAERRREKAVAAEARRRAEDMTLIDKLWPWRR